MQFVPSGQCLFLIQFNYVTCPTPTFDPNVTPFRRWPRRISWQLWKWLVDPFEQNNVAEISAGSKIRLFLDEPFVHSWTRRKINLGLTQCAWKTKVKWTIEAEYEHGLEWINCGQYQFWYGLSECTSRTSSSKLRYDKNF